MAEVYKLRAIGIRDLPSPVKRARRGLQFAALTTILGRHLPADDQSAKKPCTRQFPGMPRSNRFSQRLQAHLEFSTAAQPAFSIGDDMRFHGTVSAADAGADRAGTKVGDSSSRLTIPKRINAKPSIRPSRNTVNPRAIQDASRSPDFRAWSEHICQSLSALIPQLGAVIWVIPLRCKNGRSIPAQ